MSVSRFLIAVLYFAMLFSISGTACESLAKIVYVKTDGSDSEDGSTLDKAVKTIHQALLIAQEPGDRIQVLGGEYVLTRPVKIRAANAGVTIEAYNYEEVVITYMREPDASFGQWQRISSTANDWRIELPAPYRDDLIRIILCSRHDPSSGDGYGMPLRLMTSTYQPASSITGNFLESGANQWARYYDADTQKWYAVVRLPSGECPVADPIDPDCTVVDLRFAINTEGLGGVAGINSIEIAEGADDVVLRRLSIAGGFYPLAIYADNSTIDRCIIRNCYQDGIKLGKADLPGVQNCVIKSCDIAYWGENGIDLTFSRNCIFQDSLIHHNSITRSNGRTGTAIQLKAWIRGTRIIRNEIYSLEGSLPGTSGPTGGAFNIGTMTNGTGSISDFLIAPVYEDKITGNGVFDAEDIVIANNVFRDLGTETRPYQTMVAMSNSRQIGFYNNIFDSCHTTNGLFEFRFTPRYGSNQQFVEIDPDTWNTQIFVKNNIFYQNVDRRDLLYRERFGQDGAIPDERIDLISDHNINFNQSQSEDKAFDSLFYVDGIWKTINWDSFQEGVFTLKGFLGIPVDDVATGTGYIMYTVEDVFSRFANDPPNRWNSLHLIAVRFDGINWQYNDNRFWHVFTPAAGDRLLATVSFSDDTAVSLQGITGNIDGINYGFVDGDLVFKPNYWGTQSDNFGEFTVEGTYFDVGIGDISTVFNLKGFKGISVDDYATGTGYLMYSVDVSSRFAANPPNRWNSKQLIAVRYNGTDWEYNDNYNWHKFTPTAGDRLLAAVDFTADTATSLQGSTGKFEGIKYGFVEGDLVFKANFWGDQSDNYGEFTVEGTYFDVGPDSSDADGWTGNSPKGYGQDQHSISIAPTFIESLSRPYRALDSLSPQINIGFPATNGPDWPGGYDPYNIQEYDFNGRRRVYRSTIIDIGPTESRY